MSVANKSMDVSVIIPHYNNGKKILRAYHSVMSQTSLPKEIIIVDDCSYNKEILKSLEKNHNLSSNVILKVYYLARNHGPSFARNYAVDKSSSPYIAFLDADDYWHFEKLKIQLEIIVSHDVDFIGSSVSPNLNINFLVIKSEINTKLISFKRLLLKNYFSTPGVLMKKNIFLPFNEHQRYAEDYQLWLNLAKSNKHKMMLITSPPLVGLDKFSYGISGLSSNLWLMEKFELKNYLLLLNEGHFITLLAIPYSLFKYSRRLIISALMKLIAKK